MLEIKNIRKSFNQLEVLKDVSMSFNSGIITSIIGPSGTGKSTLLRCLIGLEKIDGGSIIIDHQEIAYDDTSLFQLRQKVGMVFQEWYLFDHMSVLENISFALKKVKSMSREAANAKAMALLELFNLADKADAYPASLSGGQKQRVAIARTIALEPQYVLFDEPTSALDVSTINEFIGVCRTLVDNGLSLIIITHDLGFAKKVSDEVYFLANGYVEEHASTSEFFSHPKSMLSKKLISEHLGE